MAGDPPTDTGPLVIEARFRRGPLSRVIHVDGAWGGLTPARGILMALYSERSTLPESLFYDVNPPSGMAKQRDLNQPQAITRDIEVEAVMTVAVAKSLAAWLLGKVQEAEKFDGHDDANPE